MNMRKPKRITLKYTTCFKHNEITNEHDIPEAVYIKIADFNRMVKKMDELHSYIEWFLGTKDKNAKKID